MPNYSSKHYAEVSRRYAEGTPQEVQALGGEKSAKDYNAEAQALLESTLNDTQITNCITEIPQDIKLELNNGTLTLKAGSKVYVPNGAGKFDVKNITVDKTYTTTEGGSIMIALLRTGELGKFTNTSSGTTQPTNPAGLDAWYDTTNNVIKRYINNVWDSDCSFPIAIVTAANGSITSIDQVFNGFGYIGSTVFALPGVKGLVPNGRNADGTLKNTEYTVPNVITFERSLTGDNIPVFLRGNNTFAISTGLLYDEVNNIVGTGGYFQVGNVDMNAGVISKFQPKTTFRAVDYNDFKRLDDEAVKVDGYQEVAGYKRFLNNELGLSNVNLVKGEAPSETRYITYAFLDKNGNSFSADQLGSAQLKIDTTGNINVQLTAIKPEAGSTETSSIGVVYNKDGSKYGYCPTPSSATDNSTKIATTEWVNNAKDMIVGWSIPDRAKAVSVSTGASYTAPSNGWLYVNIIGQKSTNEKIEIDIGGFKYNYGRSLYDNQNEDITAEIFVKKGDVCTFTVTGTWTVKFIPCKGV